MCGSLRKGSYNAAVARSLPALAPAGMTIDPAPSFASFPLYNADIQNSAGFPRDVTALAEAIRAANGVIVVSPEYNYSIPGVLKNALDWVSRVEHQPFASKPVAIQSASPSILGGARMQYHLRQSLTYCDALLFGRPEVFITFAAKKIDEKTGLLTDEPTRDVIRQQLSAFAKFIARVAEPGYAHAGRTAA